MIKSTWLRVAISALLAVGVLVAAAVEMTSDKPSIGNPPRRVGVAYETKPPPLAALENILGSKPGLDDLDLYVRSLERVVFESDRPTQKPRNPWVWKWAEPLRISLWRDVEPRHRDLLAQVASDLADITGLQITTARFSGQLAIFLDAEPGESPFCFVIPRIVGDDGALKDSYMAASPLLKGDMLTECFYEDISQALGPMNDLALTPESMFRNHDENGRWPRPTWHDVIILRTLYDRRIRPGMHKRQAMPIVRVIIAELLEELNAPAE